MKPYRFIHSFKGHEAPQHRLSLVYTRCRHIGMKVSVAKIRSSRCGWSCALSVRSCVLSARDPISCFRFFVTVSGTDSKEARLQDDSGSVWGKARAVVQGSRCGAMRNYKQGFSSHHSFEQILPNWYAVEWRWRQTAGPIGFISLSLS